MKNILWIGGIYVASLLAQLLTALLFLVLPWDPLVEAVILSCLLLVGQGCAVLGEGRLEQANQTERLLGIVYWIKRVVSAIFAAAVCHLAVIVLAGVFPISRLVRGLAALVFIMTCIGGVLLLWRAGKPEEEAAATPEEASKPGENA